MFNPEQLLGQLMGDALSGQLGGRSRKHKPKRSSGLGGLLGGVSTGTKAKVGLGLLGIAVAAYQHYSQSPSGTAPQPMVGPGAAVPPPPPPGAGVVPPPPPPPAAATERRDQALHLLRAMITAADADGLIDAGEREAILGRAREAGLDAEALQALEAEISAPLTLEQLAVRTPANLRAEVYGAALIAITADTPAERDFLERLATRLSLDGDTRRDIHAQLGVE